MKLKINKACDLNSISVLPPNSRRSSLMAQQRSQTSQQSFSQGFSSQPNGMFSQISQSSLDEVLTESQRLGTQENDNAGKRKSSLSPISYTGEKSVMPISSSAVDIIRAIYEGRIRPLSLKKFVTNILESSRNYINSCIQRFVSQEKDNTVKRVSNLAPIPYPRDESQMPISRPSVNVTGRWSSAPAPDPKFHVSDELEHRIGMMETSLSRFSMVLDSVQADVMQVNKGTKQMSLDGEGLRQKAIAHDDSLHQLNRGLEEIKTILDAGFKSVNDQLSKITQQDKLEEIQTQIVSLPELIDSCMQKLNFELSECFSGDLQAISCSLKTLHEKNVALAILPPKVTGADSSSQKWPLSSEAEPRKVSTEDLIPKIETGSWTTVKEEKVASTNMSTSSCKNLKQKRASPMNPEQKFLFDLDDESDGEVSCFGNNFEMINSGLMGEVNEETARILKLARRRKRKQSSRRPMRTYRKL